MNLGTFATNLTFYFFSFDLIFVTFEMSREFTKWKKKKKDWMILPINFQVLLSLFLYDFESKKYSNSYSRVKNLSYPVCNFYILYNNGKISNQYPKLGHFLKKGSKVDIVLNKGLKCLISLK